MIRGHFESLFKERVVEEDPEEEEEQKQPVSTANSFEEVKVFMKETNATAEDLVFFLLSDALEDPLDVINQHLPTVVKDLCGQKWPLEQGLSKFCQGLSDNLSDYPHSPEWFFNCALKPLIEAKRINLNNMKWLQEEEDDIFAVGGHILLFAQLYKLLGGKVDDKIQKAMEVLKSKFEDAGEDMEDLRARVQELTGICEKDG
jgi:hypothetical protein